jgi:hypothetical protein
MKTLRTLSLLTAMIGLWMAMMLLWLTLILGPRLHIL